MFPSLSDIRKIGMIAQRFRWRLDFITQPLAGTGLILPTELDVRCESIDIPSYDIGSTDVKIRQWNVQRNGTIKPKDISLVFIETTNGLTFDFFSAWQDAIMNLKSGKGNAKAQVSSIINLTLLNNKDEPIRLFTCFGCTLNGYDRGKADNTDEILKANITLAMDYFTESKVDMIGALSTLTGVIDYFTGKVPEYLKF